MMAVNLKKACEELAQSVEKLPKGEGVFDRNHISRMHLAVLSENVIGEKAHRWFGWIQAALVIQEIHP